MKQRGTTLVEALTACTLMGMLVLSTMGVFVMGTRMVARTSAEIDVSLGNSTAMRRVVDRLRDAIQVTISESGSKVVYQLPQMTGGNDPMTGEQEPVRPAQWDGVERFYRIVNGEMVNENGIRVLAREVVLTDPDPGSTQYQQAYAPFSLTSIGSRRALTINLITRRDVVGNRRYQRMKTTVILRNQR